MIKNVSTKKFISRVSQVYLILNFLLSSLSCPISLINWTKVVIVAVYVIVLLVVRPTKWVTYLVALSLILGLVIGIYYFGIKDSKAITTDGQTYIKGDQLTERSKKYLDAHPSVTEEEYFVEISKKKPSEVWTSESLGKNKLILGGLYSLVVGFIGFGILGGLEMIARSNSFRLQSVSGETTKN